MAAGRGMAALAASWRESEGVASSGGEFSFLSPVRSAANGAQAGEEATGASQSEASAPPANEAVGAVLQLFYLCNPGKDVTICRADLEAVLHEHLGRKEDVASVLRLLEGSRGGPPPERFDFLSYWYGMECFFMEAGSWPQPEEQSGAEDMLHGMQRFRDGVLALSRQEDDPQRKILSEDLLALLDDIKSVSQDPQYWHDVMQIVPREDGFGLTLLEVSEAVCVWLRDFLCAAESEDCERRGLGSPGILSQDRSELGVGLTPRLSPECLVAPSPRVPGLLETFRGMRKSSAPSSDGSVVAELQRASELCEVLSHAVSSDDVAGRRALAQLSLVHDSLLRSLRGQEAENVALGERNATLGERQRQLEADLARAHELLEEAREAGRRPEEQRRRTEGMELELRELKEQHVLATQELGRLQAKTAEAERELVDKQRRDWRWQDHCNKLEHAADTAEGQARWMSTEVERQAARLSTAETRSHDLRQEVAAWRWRSLAQALCGEPPSLKDLATAAVVCRKQLPVANEGSATEKPAPAPAATASPPGPVLDVGRPKTLEELQSQVRAQQAELQRVRAARDALVAAGGQAAPDAPDEELTPRKAQAFQRITFLSAQLQALLKHQHEVEQLFDCMHDARLGGPSPDVKRRLSIQRFQEEGEAVLNELSQRLYTLEVQKADADLALRQLHVRSEEQDRQLKAGSQRHELLLAELGEAMQASGQEVICKKPSRTSDLQANSKVEFYMGTDTSATSDTRSIASGGPGGGSGSNADGSAFLTPVQGQLRSSPKGVLSAGVKKVVAVHRFGFGATAQRGPRNGS